jgi:RecB family endonuclease NucS
VHRSTGYEPVNWQPGGQIIQTHLHEDILVLQATRLKPREVLTLFYDRIDLVTQLELTDYSEFILYASESDMQKAIMLHPELVELGFHPITDNKRVEPGFIDVFGRDREGNLVIIEIKRVAGGRQAVLQLWRYLQSLQQTKQTHLRGILMAPRLARGAQRLLKTLDLEFIPLSPKKCADLLNKDKRETLTNFLEYPDDHYEVVNR